MSKTKFKTWDEIKKEFKFSPEEEEQIRFEEELINTTIEIRQKKKLTQKELSKKSGIKQPAIAKLENMNRIPQTTTLIKLLYPMGYTLKVVPIDKKERNGYIYDEKGEERLILKENEN